MFKGDICIIDDQKLASDLSFNPQIKVIAMVDNAKDYFGEGTNVLAMPILLPPYIANEAENMGDTSAFWNLYWQHLADPNTDQYITLLLTGMYKGFNIVLYVSPDEECLTFTSAFLKYMQDNFGLTIATKNNQSSFNMAYTDIIRIKMYKYHYIDAMDVVMNIQNKILDPVICEMMCQDLGINAGEDPVGVIDNFIKIKRTPQKVIPAVKVPFSYKF